MEIFMSHNVKELMRTESKFRRTAESMIRDFSLWASHQDNDCHMYQPVVLDRRHDCCGSYFHLCIDYNKEENEYELY